MSVIRCPTIALGEIHKSHRQIIEMRVRRGGSGAACGSIGTGVTGGRYAAAPVRES